MNKYSIHIIYTAIFLTICGIFSYVLANKKSEHERLITEIKDSLTCDYKKIYGNFCQVKINMAECNKNIGREINLETICYDYNGAEHPFKELISPNKIFVRIKETECWSCIKEISESINDSNIKDVVYLVSYYDSTTFKTLYVYSDISKPTYRIKGNLNIPIDSIDEPYLFTINQRKVEKVFLPIKGEQDFTTDFLMLFE